MVAGVMPMAGCVAVDIDVCGQPISRRMSLILGDVGGLHEPRRFWPWTEWDDLTRDVAELAQKDAHAPAWSEDAQSRPREHRDRGEPQSGPLPGRLPLQRAEMHRHRLVRPAAERAAEVAAARAASTTYIDVLPWLCSTSVSPTACSAIIGDATNGYHVVYYSAGHITKTYDLFLTGVLRSALKRSMS